MISITRVGQLIYLNDKNTYNFIKYLFVESIKKWSVNLITVSLIMYLHIQNIWFPPHSSQSSSRPAVHFFICRFAHRLQWQKERTSFCDVIAFFAWSSVWIDPEQCQPDSKWITMAIWSKTRVTSDLGCNNFPEEKRQFSGLSEECSWTESRPARIYCQDTSERFDKWVCHRSGCSGERLTYTERTLRICSYLSFTSPPHTFITHAGVLNVQVDICRENKRAKCIPLMLSSPSNGKKKQFVTAETQLTLAQLGFHKLHYQETRRHL